MIRSDGVSGHTAGLRGSVAARAAMAVMVVGAAGVFLVSAFIRWWSQPFWRMP